MNDDLIRRQDAIKLYEQFQPYIAVKAVDFKKALEQLPSAQPERKKGQWISNDNGTYSCSVCQSWIPEEQHCYARYCLYCGADMRGESDG